MIGTDSKIEDVTDTAGVDVGFDNDEDEWESLELRLDAGALAKSTVPGMGQALLRACYASILRFQLIQYLSNPAKRAEVCQLVRSLLRSVGMASRRGILQKRRCTFLHAYKAPLTLRNFRNEYCNCNRKPNSKGHPSPVSEEDAGQSSAFFAVPNWARIWKLRSLPSWL